MLQSALRLHRVIVATGVLFVAAFAASTAYDGWRLRQQVTSATERELGNLAKALADESARSLQAVDLLLQDTASWYEEKGAKQSAEQIAAALAARSIGVTQVSVLTIVDESGLQRYRSRQTGEPLANISDRPYFHVQQAQAAAGLYINEPVVTRTERLPALVVSRRLNAPDGSFDGVVTAIVTLQRLQGMFSALQLGAGSSLALALDNGSFVVRQPETPRAGERLRAGDIAALRLGQPLRRTKDSVDGRWKFVAAVGIGDRPLTLVITRDEAVALRPWIDAMWGSVTRTILLSLLAVITVAAVLRQLRRQEISEQALRESEERYAMAMDAASEGHAEWNVRLDTVFACKKWRSLHGLDEGARLQTSMDIAREVDIHAEDALPTKATIDEHMSGCSAMIELEYRIRRRDGGWRWVHTRGRCLLDDAGTPLRLFCSAVDVSERRAAEAERVELNARLQHARQLEALGTFAGGIAHDFNNILGAILGFGQMAQQHVEADSPSRRHIDRVLQAGARARLLVRRILDFSRSGVGERVPVNAQQVVEEVLAMLTPSLPIGVTISAQLNAENVAVIGDATQLHQVVMNVCTNAAQAIGEEGAVKVTLDAVDLADLLVPLQGALQPGPHVRLEVEDNGAGISPEVLTRIFDPFFTTKKVGEGTGLGLAVVHGIVSDMGGAIDVVSQRGRGTRVSIWLPVAVEAELLATSAPSQWPRGAGEVVMVVDDEPALVELAEEFLAELGYEPVGFNSPEAALNAVSANPNRFDAVLTDESMPGLRGTDLALAISALRPDLPVILVSGNVSPDIEKLARDSGVRDLLHKPLSLHVLSESLDRQLAGRRVAPTDC